MTPRRLFVSIGHHSPPRRCLLRNCNGVSPVCSLKARLKADMTWNQMVRGKFSQQLNPSEKDIFEAEMKTEQKESGVEYTLHPITFVVARG